MTREEIIRQLKSLRAHCAYQAAWSPEEDSWRKDVEALDAALEYIRATPTITQPNEWISVEERLPGKEAWYHVAILDKKTGSYSVENDLYAVELAIAHGHEPGFCKARRWEEREELIAFDAAAIGKTVFLTPEVALAEQKGDRNG